MCIPMWSLPGGPVGVQFPQAPDMYPESSGVTTHCPLPSSIAYHNHNHEGSPWWAEWRFKSSRSPSASPEHPQW